MEFGSYIREVRKSKNLSLREAAKRSGISHPYLSQLETGKNDNPTKEIVQKLAKGLEADYNELMFAAGLVTPEKRIELMKKANEAINTPEQIEARDKMETDWKKKNNFIELTEVFSEKSTLAIDGQLLTKNGQLLSSEDKQKMLEMIKLHLS